MQLGEAGGARQAGRQAASPLQREAQIAMDSFFSLSSQPLPYPARPGCLLLPPPHPAILGVVRGCGCFLWLCVFVVRVLKREIETASGGGGGSGGVYPQSRSAPLATKSPLLPASAVN